MSTNLKSIKIGHFGGGGGAGGAGFGISAGKLLTNNNTNGNTGGAAGAGGGIGVAASGASAGSSSGGAGAGGGGSKSASHATNDADVFAMPSGAIIPLIRSRDVPKMLPTLAAALQRSADDHLAAEDLDAVQLELELMLSNVALRARVLKSEYDSLDKDEKRQDRRKLERMPPASPPINQAMLNGILGMGSAGGGGGAAAGASGAAGVGGAATAAAAGAANSGTAGVGSPANTNNSSSNNSSSNNSNNNNSATGNSKRKLREEPTGVRKKHSSMTILKQQQQQQHLQAAVGKQLNKNSPMAVHTDDSMDYAALPNINSSNNINSNNTNSNNSSNNNSNNNNMQPQLPKVSMPKNDMPNKFWLSIEPYCMPLTNEDLRLIDDLLEQYRGPLVPPVPTLGPHYSTVWAQEDMKSLQPGGARQKSQNASAMLKKADGLLAEESITGPLTQRLVSALMDESLPSEQAAVGEHSSNSSSNENTHSSSAGAAAVMAATAPGNFRSLSMLKHGVGIEQRLKKELIESGLIDASELAAHEDVDEVLLEIKRVTAEISSVAQFNSDELKRLRAAASEEIKRIELKRKLDTIDQEILECYKRMLQYRAKRKGHTQEEKQEILRLTSEQRALADQLERMQLMGMGIGHGIGDNSKL